MLLLLLLLSSRAVRAMACAGHSFCKVFSLKNNVLVS